MKQLIIITTLFLIASCSSNPVSQSNDEKNNGNSILPSNGNYTVIEDTYKVTAPTDTIYFEANRYIAYYFIRESQIYPDVYENSNHTKVNFKKGFAAFISCIEGLHYRLVLFE